MIQAIAIFVAGVMIAAAILLTNHWSTIHYDPVTGVLLLNHWTGSITLCSADQSLKLRCHQID
jgi:hypothetical protein